MQVEGSANPGYNFQVDNDRAADLNRPGNGCRTACPHDEGVAASPQAVMPQEE